MPDSVSGSGRGALESVSGFSSESLGRFDGRCEESGELGPGISSRLVGGELPAAGESVTAVCGKGPRDLVDDEGGRRSSAASALRALHSFLYALPTESGVPSVFSPKRTQIMFRPYALMSKRRWFIARDWICVISSLSACFFSAFAEVPNSTPHHLPWRGLRISLDRDSFGSVTMPKYHFSSCSDFPRTAHSEYFPHSSFPPLMTNQPSSLKMSWYRSRARRICAVFESGS